MLRYVCAVTCFLSLANAGSVLQSNQYVDSIFINSLPSEILRNRQDPVKIPDFSQEFKDKIALVTVNVKTDYKNGNLTGLSRPLREKNCTATSYLRGQFIINCTLALNSLHINYQGTTKYGVVPSINFKVMANVQKVLFDFKIASVNNGRMPQVNELRLISGVFFNPQFSGLGMASSFEKNLRANFTVTATNHIINTLNTQFKTALQRSVANTIMPL